MTAIVRMTAAVLLLSAASLFAQGTKQALQPAAERKPAPDFRLPDSAGGQASAKDYQGKVVVLDFWATWCHGCNEEMPWFAEFHRKYADQGLSIIGISMDDDGWKVVKPFITKTAVPYRIVLGNDSVAKAYAIGNMPDTFLLDREGRIAAAYVGVVDRNNLEENIQSLLAEK